jgi:hypothetical protein
MTSMRNVLLLGGLLVLSACATQTFNPDRAPEYTITRSFTPFYSERPIEGATTDISLNEKTRVKLLRKEREYSLVQLEDSRTGYVANKNMAVPPPGPQERRFGSTSEESGGEESQPKPRRKKRISRVAAPTPSPSPVSQREQARPAPPQEVAPPAPTPTPPAAPKETPSPTPAPTPQATPLEKPKFRL